MRCHIVLSLFSLDRIATDLAMRSVSRRNSYFPTLPPRSPLPPVITLRRSSSKLIPVTEEQTVFGNNLKPFESLPLRRSSLFTVDSRVFQKENLLRGGLSSNVLNKDLYCRHVMSELSCQTLLSRDSNNCIV